MQKNRFLGKISALLIAIALAISVSACGTQQALPTEHNYSAVATDTFDGGGLKTTDAETEVSESQEKNSISTKNDSVYSNSNVKLIRTANLSFETTSFEACCDSIEEEMQQNGGYIESCNTTQGGYYGIDSKRAEYTIRIPSEKYAEFMHAITSKEGWCLDSKLENTEDIGLAYADTENELKTLQIKLERLQALLKKADKMSDIIELEEKISEIESQIKSNGAQLKRYDSLISYSKFIIEVREVKEIENSEEQPYFTQLGNSFVNGIKRCGQFLKDASIWLSGNIVPLAMMLVIIAILRKVGSINTAKNLNAGTKAENNSLEKGELPQKPKDSN